MPRQGHLRCRQRHRCLAKRRSWQHFPGDHITKTWNIIYCNRHIIYYYHYCIYIYIYLYI
jgi:hypothetical protein